MILRKLKIFPGIIGFNIFKRIGYPKILPIILTLSVNDYCNARCKTCNIWKNDPIKKRKEELKLEEYKKIFDNYDKKVYWTTVTGGEPFLRDDLTEIIKVVYEKAKPSFISIATNGILTNKILFDTKEILKCCPKLNLILNLSLDGIGTQHDEIRGVRKNFDTLVKTFRALKTINNNMLTVGINTVISKYNVGNFSEIYYYVAKKLNPDSHIVEIAENRAKLYNMNLKIVPKEEKYKDVLKFLVRKQRGMERSIPNLIKSIRKEFYYYLLTHNFPKNFEGIASGYIMSNGEVWLSYSRKFVVGNLRNVNYNFRSLWFNKKAEKYRKVMEKNYNTTLANAFYTNFICNLRYLSKLTKFTIR